MSWELLVVVGVAVLWGVARYFGLFGAGSS
jgi:hypothetical protein